MAAGFGGIVADRWFLAVPVLVAVVIGADVFLNDSVVSLIAVKKLQHLVEYLEFWR
jgi:hypothetical protein